MVKPEVSIASLYDQIVKNTVDEMEIFREAISNSVDAEANLISISVEFRQDSLQDIIIQDNGHGILYDSIDDERNGISAFWSIAKSVKKYAQRAIGEKGLGSKTYLRAEYVSVSSYNGTVHLFSEMYGPLTSLQNGDIPEYYPENPVSDSETTGFHETGTRIVIKGVRISSLNPNGNAESNANKIQDYIHWKTAGGTFKNKFNHLPYLQNEIPNIHVIPSIELEIFSPEEPLPYRTSILGLHPFPEDSPQPENGPLNDYQVQENSLNYSDSFSFSRTIGGINYQVYGSVSGKSKREGLVFLRSGETHKSRFGLYLCKDFIPVEKYKQNAILHQEYYYSCHVFLNCQNFSLDASRNAVTNLSNAEIVSVLEDFRQYFEQQYKGHLDRYMEMSRTEKNETERRKKIQEMQQIKTNFPDGYTSLPDSPLKSITYIPKNEYSTALILAAMLESGNYETELKPLSSIAQHVDKATDMIALNDNNEPLLVEIEYRLSNLFKHGHALDSYDLVVVWSVGDAAAGDHWETVDGVKVTLRGVTGDWKLRFGQTDKKLIILQEFI